MVNFGLNNVKFSLTLGRLEIGGGERRITQAMRAASR